MTLKATETTNALAASQGLRAAPIAEDTERLKHKTQITHAGQDLKPLLSMVLEKHNISYQGREASKQPSPAVTM